MSTNHETRIKWCVMHLRERGNEVIVTEAAKKTHESTDKVFLPHFGETLDVAATAVVLNDVVELDECDLDGV